MADYIWNNMAFNSEDEMKLAMEIPAVYLDRWSDSGYVAEAVLGSGWLAEHDRQTAERAWDEGRRRTTGLASGANPVNPYKVTE